MNQERKLSFFLPPISPVKDANGKNVTPATLVPHKELTLEERQPAAEETDRSRSRSIR